MKKIIQYLFKQVGYRISRIDALPITSNTDITVSESEFTVNYKNVLIDSKKYFVPSYALHRPAAKKIIRGEFSEPKTHKLVELLGQNKRGSIIHAGTFFGDMLPNFARFTNGTVFAFEPVLENFILAKLTVQENDLENVVISNSALSDRIANLKINTLQKNGLHAGGSSSISQNGSICTSLTIDSLEAEDLVLIQLDVEGHELQALSGATETIGRCRPVIAIEDNEKSCDKFLLGLNYQFVKQIPGLQIWIPAEDKLFDRIVKSL